jgi:hypothetical protein
MDEDERPGRSVQPLAVELEHGATAEDEVELFLIVVVFGDEAIARGVTRPSVDAERRDAEVMTYGPQSAAAVRDLFKLVQTRDFKAAHTDLLYALFQDSKL